MDDTADTAQVIIRPPLAWGLAARYSRPIATKSEVEAQKPLPTLTQSSPMLEPRANQIRFRKEIDPDEAESHADEYLDVLGLTTNHPT
jgi:hypothetical protein